MIIYGWNKVKISSQRPPQIKCYNCKNVGQVFVNRYLKYWHIFWIPMFPYKIIDEFECVSCKNAFEFKEIEPELKQVYRQYKSSKIPIWSFSGLIIILGLVVYSFIPNTTDKAEMKSRINTAVVNRICDFKTEDNEYSSFKICTASKDSLFITYNKYQVKNIKDIDEINRPEYFDNDTIAISRENLDKMMDENILQDIHW